MHELLTADEMQAADAAAVAQGIDSFALMQCAGRAVASSVFRAASSSAHIVVVAGPGNNGGDGAIAASALAAWGCAVTLLTIGTPRAGSDAARAFDGWQGNRCDVLADAEHSASTTTATQPTPMLSTEAQRHLNDAHVIVDALFGAGLNRPFDAPMQALVEQINTRGEQSGVRVIAVDLPSGIDGNRATLAGQIAIQADHTVTFFRYKPAHLLLPARSYCGQRELIQIGIPDSVLDSLGIGCEINTPDAWSSALPSPVGSHHKFDRGHVVVRGGPVTQTGAARLSAMTALQCGAGLVTLTSPETALPVNAAQLTSVMLKVCEDSLEWRDIIAQRRVNVAVVGPGNGVGDSTRQCVEAVLANAPAVVIDADAITSCAEQPEQLFEQIQGHENDVVMTPHAGEFARLFRGAGFDNLPSRLHKARYAAYISGAVIIYKGSDTVIAAPDGRARINANAPPWLATAGAGDVLCGLLAALLAQGMTGFDAASAAVWLHGDAAVSVGYPLTADMLVQASGAALGRQVNATSSGWTAGLT